MLVGNYQFLQRKSSFHKVDLMVSYIIRLCRLLCLHFSLAELASCFDPESNCYKVEVVNCEAISMVAKWKLSRS